MVGLFFLFVLVDSRAEHRESKRGFRTLRSPTQGSALRTRKPFEKGSSESFNMGAVLTLCHRSNGLALALVRDIDDRRYAQHIDLTDKLHITDNAVMRQRTILIMQCLDAGNQAFHRIRCDNAINPALKMLLRQARRRRIATRFS